MGETVKPSNGRTGRSTAQKTRAGSTAPGPVFAPRALSGQVAADDLFDLGASIPVAQAGVDQPLARDDEGLLGTEHVDERACTERVALLVDAESFLGCANADLLKAHLRLGIAKQAEVGDDGLLIQELRVLQ